MAGFYSGFTQQDLTADGDTSDIGYVDVADAAFFEVGATVSIVSDTVDGIQYQVATVDTVANRIGVRLLYTGTPRLNGQNYGLSPTDQFTTTDNAYVVQNVQFLYDESATSESGGGGGISIGNFGGLSADGLSLTAGVLSLTAANATNPGGVSTGAQTWSGVKTSADGIVIAAGKGLGLNGDVPGTTGFTVTAGVMKAAITGGSFQFSDNSVNHLLLSAATAAFSGNITTSGYAAASAGYGNGSSGAVQGLSFSGSNTNLVAAGDAFFVRVGSNTGLNFSTHSSAGVELVTVGQGFILKSPDGTRYKIAVANGGALSTVPA